MTVAHAPGEASQASIPVTVQQGEVVTVLGSSETPIAPEQLTAWSEEANDALALVLADSWYVEIFDPVWGRNDILLPAVLEALTEELSSGAGQDAAGGRQTSADGGCLVQVCAVRSAPAFP